MKSFGCMVDMYLPYLSVCSVQVVIHTVLYTLILQAQFLAFQCLHSETLKCSGSLRTRLTLCLRNQHTKQKKETKQNALCSVVMDLFPNLIPSFAVLHTER